MRCSGLGTVIVLCALTAPVGSAGAEEDPNDLAAAEVELPPARLSYDEYRRNELEFLARRSRIPLISSSAAVAVGIALVVPALAAECVRVASSSSVDDVRCTQTGKALLGVGVPFLAAGVLGIIISGTMFGVRKGKIRNLDNRIAYEKSSAVRWDPSRAVFEF